MGLATKLQALLLLPTLVCGCTSTKRLKTLSPEDRAAISTIAITAEHADECEPHSMMLEVRRGPLGSTYSIIGYRGYTKKRWVEEAREYGEKVVAHLAEHESRHFEAFLTERLTGFSEEDGTLSIVDSPDGASARLKLFIGHRSTPDYSYASLRSELYNAEGEKIYDRVDFSSHWNEAKLKAGLAPNLEGFLRMATTNVWRDLAQ